MLKDLIGKITRMAGPTIGNNIGNAVNKVVSNVSKESKSYTFSSLPKNLEELQRLPEATLQDPFAVAALTVLALTSFQEDREACYAMLGFLKGPGGPLSPAEKQFIADRFMDGKFYKVMSFFEGATPANNYTPAQPYRITVSSNPYSYENQGYAVLYLQSGGADSPRPVSLRNKPSTGQWFYTQIDYLSDIRVPAAQDGWR